MQIKGDRLEFDAILQVTGREVQMMNFLASRVALSAFGAIEQKNQFLDALLAATTMWKREEWEQFFGAMKISTDDTIKRMTEAEKAFKHNGR